MNTQDLIALARERAHHVRDGESFVIGVEWTLKQIASTQPKTDERGSAEPEWKCGECGVSKWKCLCNPVAKVINRPGFDLHTLQWMVDAKTLPDGIALYAAPARDGSEPGLREDIAPINEGARRRPAIVKGKRAEPQGLTDAEIVSLAMTQKPTRHRYGADVFEFRLFDLLAYARAIESALAARASAGRTDK